MIKRHDVMKHYGLTRDLPRSGYFETEQLREVFDDIKVAIHGGKPWPSLGSSAAAIRQPSTG